MRASLEPWPLRRRRHEATPEQAFRCPILDVYKLEDVAAEILLATPNLFPGALDFLARKVHGVGYQQVTEAFMADPIGFHHRLKAKVKSK